MNSESITPHTESFHAVIWHLLVSHPKLKAMPDEVGIVRLRRRQNPSESAPPNPLAASDPGGFPRPGRGASTARCCGTGFPIRPNPCRIWKSFRACGRPSPLLKSAGFRLVVVTNQPDVARGTQTREEVEAIHELLLRTLPLDAVKVCYHDDADRCSCRKPAPGMILEAAAELDVDLSRSYMVGDRWKDIEAGERAGTTTILIENEYPEKKPGNAAARVGSLREAAEWIMRKGEGAHMKAENMRVKIFADGADKDGMLEMYKLPYIRGFTTNPTLMRKAGHQGLPRIRQGNGAAHSRPADLLRGVLRRLPRHGAPGAWRSPRGGRTST